MIDSHAHLSSSMVLDDVDPVIQRAKEGGIERIINICTDEKSLSEGLKLAKRYKEISNTAATTPHDVQKEGESFFPLVEKAAVDLVAIGETGLDYFYEHSSKKLQREFLERYLLLADRLDLPVVFHCREAFEDLLAICAHVYPKCQAVLHCFTGTKEEAKAVLDRGWFVSFSGIITFKKSQALREVVSYVPLDRMFVETDTPYLAPQGMRGKQNEPAYLIETVEKIAEIKGVQLREVEEVTSQNITQFFALK